MRCCSVIAYKAASVVYLLAPRILSNRPFKNSKLLHEDVVMVAAAVEVTEDKEEDRDEDGVAILFFCHEMVKEFVTRTV